MSTATEKKQEYNTRIFFLYVAERGNLGMAKEEKQEYMQYKIKILLVNMMEEI